jgi:hypothetical protein
MAICNDYDGFVTDSYVRVFAPPDLETARVCPNCENEIREGGRRAGGPLAATVKRQSNPCRHHR